MLDWLVQNLLKAGNHTLSYQNIDHERYQELYNKNILWRIEEPKIDFVSTLSPNQINIHKKYASLDIHLVVTADLWTLIYLIRGIKNTKQKFTLQGDHQLANLLKSYLQELSIDWEKYLADIIGESSAYLIIQQIKKNKKWLSDSKKASLKSGQTFLQDTGKFTPNPRSLERFYQQVTELHHDIDRLERQMQNLPPKEH